MVKRMVKPRDGVGRRSLLKFMGAASMLPARIVHEVAAPGQDASAKPAHSIRFSVIGVDHSHILSMTAAVIRGGGQLVSFHGTVPKGIADFQRRYPDAKAAKSEDEILSDPSIQLVASASIPDQRAALGIRAMRHGKDFLADKPAITA